MKRHPSVLARYIRERVPAKLLQSLFRQSPIEADDLATLLGALKTNLQEETEHFGPDAVAEYLRQLLRTRTADIQFGMLSSSEKEVLRSLVSALPAGTASDVRKDLRAVLGD